MNCQKCQKREATHHESLLASDGTWAESHLCDGCAEEGESTSLSPASLLQAMAEGATALSGARPATPGRPCPKCGITYGEFRARGRLGCPHDYDAFQAELTPLLERIHHGRTQHVGKSPSSTDGRSESDRLLIELRRALAEAVQGERYEEAARLRDRIRRVEEGGAEADLPAAGGKPATGGKAAAGSKPPATGKESPPGKEPPSGKGRPRGKRKP